MLQEETIEDLVAILLVDVTTMVLYIYMRKVIGKDITTILILDT